MKIELTFPGTPIALQRPRFNQKSGVVYNPQSKEMHVLSVLAIAQMRQKGLEMLSDGPISVEIRAYSSPPSTWPQKRLKCVDTDLPYKPTKPDLDNVCKLVLDILNGIAYSDDKLVSRLLCEKRYSTQPRVEIIISRLDCND